MPICPAWNHPHLVQNRPILGSPVARSVSQSAQHLATCSTLCRVQNWLNIGFRLFCFIARFPVLLVLAGGGIRLGMLAILAILLVVLSAVLRREEAVGAQRSVFRGRKCIFVVGGTSRSTASVTVEIIE